MYINHVDLAPRDDLESLSLLALFLLRGSLPWIPRPPSESQLRSQEIVRLLKSSCPAPMLSSGFPEEFGEMLMYSRSLEFGKVPDYEGVRGGVGGLGERMGYDYDFLEDGKGPLDWAPCPAAPKIVVEEPEVSIPDEEEDEGSDDEDLGEDSYWGMDIDIWERQGERDKDVTSRRQSSIAAVLALSR